MNQQATPISQLTASQFVAASLVLPVRRSTNPASIARLEVPPEFAGRLQALRLEAGRATRAVGGVDISGAFVNQILDLAMSGDVWHCRLPNGTTVIVTMAELLEEMDERSVVEQVHHAEIDSALGRGESVPPEVVSYYRGKASARAEQVAA